LIVRKEKPSVAIHVLLLLTIVLTFLEKSIFATFQLVTILKKIFIIPMRSKYKS
jgi:hypothetical protein